MSDSAWTLLMIVLAPIVFINLVLFGLLVRAALQISKETKLADRLKRRWYRMLPDLIHTVLSV